MECLRHSWLLALLSTRLGYHARDRVRLLALLALGDEELIQAIGGRRRRELRERYARFAPEQVRSSGTGVETICRHRHGYPRGLLQARERAPWMLYVAGGAVGRLQELSTAPAVAIVGSRRATDYGMEMARSLARGLSASGVTVVGGLADGIAVAAQEGALEAGGNALAVLDGGLDVACPARRRALYGRLLARAAWWRSCRAGANPGTGAIGARADRRGTGAADDLRRGRRGPRRAAGRADRAGSGQDRCGGAGARHLAGVAGHARAAARRSRAGAGPGDALELLYQGPPPRDSRDPRALPGAPQSEQARKRNYGTKRRIDAQRGTKPALNVLKPRLQATLEQVGAGNDTPAKLSAASADAGEALLALGELELMGLLTRGDGGRYVPRQSLAGR